jgi:hypothetical protein
MLSFSELLIYNCMNLKFSFFQLIGFEVLIYSLYFIKCAIFIGF